MKAIDFKVLDLDPKLGTLPLIIWGICGGLAIGAFFSLLNRTAAHSVISSLREKGAEDRETAVTLAEAGVKARFPVGRMLREGGVLRRYVKMANEEECGKKDLLDAGRFYLPEENRIGAEVRFTAEKSPIRSFILTVLLLAAVGVAATFVVPELLIMLDNLLSSS